MCQVQGFWAQVYSDDRYYCRLQHTWALCVHFDGHACAAACNKPDSTKSPSASQFCHTHTLIKQTQEVKPVYRPAPVSVPVFVHRFPQPTCAASLHYLVAPAQRQDYSTVLVRYVGSSFALKMRLRCRLSQSSLLSLA